MVIVVSLVAIEQLKLLESGVVQMPVLPNESSTCTSGTFPVPVSVPVNV